MINRRFFKEGPKCQEVHFILYPEGSGHLFYGGMGKKLSRNFQASGSSGDILDADGVSKGEGGIKFEDLT
ncbi:MAG: hypothetical protein ACYCOO_06845 [Chitinophagaceae bacterium]